MTRRLIAALGLLALAASSAAGEDRCSRDIAIVSEALAAPQIFPVVREAVDDLLRKAQADQQAGNPEACVTRLASAKKILKID